MRRNEKPILLTIYDLKKPIDTTKNKLKEIFNEIKKDHLGQVSIQGLFILGISSFEIMISEMLTYYLCCLPQKLESKDMKLSKEDLLEENIIDVYVEKTIISLMYKRLDEILLGFSNILSIEFKSIEKYIDKLVEMKETRNLLLHNNLVVNNSYLDKTLNYKRADRINQKLDIDSQYALESLSIVDSLVAEIEEEIINKYSSYTKIKLLRDLWDYLFHSPLLKNFDDYWDVDEEHDTIPALKHCDREKSISHSEKMVLGVWRAQFNDNSENLSHFNMRSLDTDNQKRMLFFLSKASKISFY